MDTSDKKDAKFEENLFSQVLHPYSSKIIELETAYGLILDLITVFERIYPEYDRQIDEYCRELYEIVEMNVEEVEDEIESRYNSDGLNDLPSFYINTDIFSTFSYPVRNLHDIEINGDWKNTVTKLNKSYGLLKDLSRKVDKNGISTPNQDLFDRVKNYIKGVTFLECGDLRLDLERGTLQYKLNKPQNVSIGTQVIRFLIMLLKSDSKILEYKKVARELDLNSYHRDWNNKDTGEELRYLNRDLHELLKKSGMSKTEIDSYISIVTNVGFKLNC